MAQLLLFPDPRPLVERLGAAFFRQAPCTPGVYLMKDAAGSVIYVGKAVNLRKRLASYRVANPNRRLKRHLRLLHSVHSIELQECADERAALARESELLRTLRPRFNRAGTWPGTPRYLCWRVSDKASLEMTVAEEMLAGWYAYGPTGAGAVFLRNAIARLCWCAVDGARGYGSMPFGWAAGNCGQSVAVPMSAGAGGAAGSAEHLAALLGQFFAQAPGLLLEWLRERLGGTRHLFEQAAIREDLEHLEEVAARLRRAGDAAESP